jgi:uncharacterized membrane protein YfcA
MESDLVACGVLLGGAVSGATGVAFPVIAGPLLLLEYQPAQAVLLTAICSLAGQFFSMGLLRHSIEYRVRWSLVLPGLLCIPIGTTLLSLASPAAMRIGFGALLAVSSLCVLVRPPLFASRSKLVDVFVGACGGGMWRRIWSVVGDPLLLALSSGASSARTAQHYPAVYRSHANCVIRAPA